MISWNLNHVKTLNPMYWLLDCGLVSDCQDYLHTQFCRFAEISQALETHINASFCQFQFFFVFQIFFVPKKENEVSGWVSYIASGVGFNLSRFKFFLF